MRVIKGGVTAPVGFLANGISCGIKMSGKKDLALIYSTVKAKAYALFTSNQVKAAPVLVSIDHLRDHQSHAILINSGNANCFTGVTGIAYARKTAIQVADALGIEDTDVLVSSTGIIGKSLPFRKIVNAVPPLVAGLHKHKAHDAAVAIMTTDTVAKEIAVEYTSGSKKVRVAGMAKGAGMIFPDLQHATMLCFITTDASIDGRALQAALQEATDISFNRISIDACRSTNDSVYVLANGLAMNKTISCSGREYDKFQEALSFVCLHLAKAIIKDAEGAEKFITITVRGARSSAEAQTVGFAIANSPLFKTAMHGENPNFGRIVSAIGASGVPVRPEDISVRMSSLKKKDIVISAGIGSGRHSATVYTCDMSKEYIAINADYN